MWGAIIGDIVGSRFEGTGIKTKEFDLLTHDCRYTDDSACTAAVAASLLDGLPADLTLRVWCHRHPARGYGGMFARWLEQEAPQAYGSFGNGVAMRVSPEAYLTELDPRGRVRLSETVKVCLRLESGRSAPDASVGRQEHRWSQWH